MREYQQIGLDWLMTIYSRRLNGILADEMGVYTPTLRFPFVKTATLHLTRIFLFISWWLSICGIIFITYSPEALELQSPCASRAALCLSCYGEPI